MTTDTTTVTTSGIIEDGYNATSHAVLRLAPIARMVVHVYVAHLVDDATVPDGPHWLYAVPGRGPEPECYSLAPSRRVVNRISLRTAKW